MHLKSKPILKTRLVILFCFFAFIAFICVWMLQWIGQDEADNEKQFNEIMAAPSNSDTWIDSSSYYSQPSGSGTEASPYLISSAANLAWISANSYDLDGCYFRQTANINLGAHYWTPINIDLDSVCYYYDGGGYYISNLFVDLPTNEYVGLFAFIDASGADEVGYITNLGIYSGTIEGESSIGAIVGYANTYEITNCYNRATLTTEETRSNYLGGLIGEGDDVVISDCYNSGTVTGAGRYVAGLIGYGSSSSTVSYSYNTGSITGEDMVAGIAGSADIVIGSYNTGYIKSISTSDSNSVAGIAARADVIISYNEGTVRNYSTKSSSRTAGITASGFANSCYNTVSVSASAGYRGGIIASGSQAINCYYVSGSGYTNSEGTVVTLSRMSVTTTGVAPTYMSELSTFDWTFTARQRPKPKTTDFDYGTTSMPKLQNGNGVNSKFNPYLISTAAELAYLSENYVWASGKYFLQTADIDLSSYTHFVPINFAGDDCYYFYDGGEHTISNFNIQTARNYVALFGRNYSSNSSIKPYVKNLGIISGEISGSRYVSAIVGSGNGTIKNCYNQATLSGYHATAGIAGSFSGTIDSCYNTGSITCSSNQGAGVCGGLNGSISNCYNTGTIDSGGLSGGVVGGVNTDNTVSRCYNTGQVTGSSGGVGGIVGSAQTSGVVIEYCYNTGRVTGTGGGVGGIVGGTYSVSVRYAYNTGYVYDSLNDAYYGISHSVSTTSCFYNTSQSNSGGSGIALTISQMTVTTNGVAPSSMTGFTTADWTFVAGNTPQVIFKTPYFDTEGTEDDPYLIYTAEDLAYVSDNYSNSDIYNHYFFQVNNIDLSAYSNWTPINQAGSSYAYYYNGNNCSISNLNVSNSAYAGLFGRNNGYIRNLKITSGNITGSGTYTGGLVGYSTGEIINCSNSANVTGSGTYVGGLAGYTTNMINNSRNEGRITSTGSNASSGGLVGFITGNVVSCYNTGGISATGSYSKSGGIAGTTSGMISNAYNTGEVSAVQYAGGIVGTVNAGSGVSSCYNIGTISAVTVGGVVGFVDEDVPVSVAWCYFNTDISGLSEIGAIGNTEGYQCFGLTTSQMQGLQNANYMNLSNTFWNFASGSYPTLKYVATAQN